MVETIMYPIMYPIMRMYDYFDGRSFSGRSSSDDFVPNMLLAKVILDLYFVHHEYILNINRYKIEKYNYIIIVSKVITMVQEEIYKEDCLSRLICQLGKSAQGYDTFVE